MYHYYSCKKYQSDYGLTQDARTGVITLISGGSDTIYDDATSPISEEQLLSAADRIASVCLSDLNDYEREYDGTFVEYFKTVNGEKSTDYDYMRIRLYSNGELKTYYAEYPNSFDEGPHITVDFENEKGEHIKAIEKELDECYQGKEYRYEIEGAPSVIPNMAFFRKDAEKYVFRYTVYTYIPDENGEYKLHHMLIFNVFKNH